MAVIDFPTPAPVPARLEQLKRYAEWEKQQFPGDRPCLHILDWAVAEIETLRQRVVELERVTPTE